MSISYFYKQLFGAKKFGSFRETGPRDRALARALASLQCSLDSNPGIDRIVIEFAVGSRPFLKGFSRVLPVFPPLYKQKFLNFNLIHNPGYTITFTKRRFVYFYEDAHMFYLLKMSSFVFLQMICQK